ncbi:hypothetical protein [uncultured Cohaesibacter sp.]|uniref:hypothetical protein n=1 Tax=uncultured Cohaesibacter sp. TaxID=1002546 RepID=UPI0029C62F22|nr:hypothetical protein [uncultured Cohaesibacter sp.]
MLPSPSVPVQREMSEEMAQSMAEANSRFEQATQDIRSITQEIKRDLDMTRNELKQGLNELPGETREATGAMRRVVSEQIDALKELSRVVQRHGNAFDTIPAERASSRASSAPAPAAQAPAPAPAPRSLPPVQQTTRQPEPQQPRRTAELAATPLLPLMRMMATAPVVGSPTFCVGPPSRMTTCHSRAMQAALEPLSRDIVRGIDDNNQAMAWESYRRGEGGSFTRRPLHP